MNEPLVSLMLAVADDELIMGHRHSEWTGYAPHIEEDVAFSSIAQDEIGHAAAAYRLVAELTEDDADRLALGREPHEYRNAIFCERENRDWAYTLSRHWLYDHADAVRLEALESSTFEPLAQLVAKVRREERYHLLHADSWIRRVAQGPVEGRTKLIAGLGDAFGEAGGIFEPFELEQEALEQGWLPLRSEEMHQRFQDVIQKMLDDLGLPAQADQADEPGEFVASSSGDLLEPEKGPAQGPESGDPGFGGRIGKHSTDFYSLWETMTLQYRQNPGARW